MKTHTDNSFVAVRTKFIREGQISFMWLTKPVEEVIGTKNEVRCAICEGAVRVHSQRVLHGPRPHVEHLRTEDSERCPNGFWGRKK